MIARQLSRRFAFPRLGALLLGLLLSGQAAWAGTIILYYPDAQGNPVVATDIDGNIIWRKHFTPYGKELNGVPDDLGYTGHEYDQETGLTYMQARYYDPVVGRFLSPDPVGFDPNQPMTFNRYSYANNNPYKYIDPDGRNVTTAFGGVLYESAQFVQGNGFDGQSVMGALADGYDGQGAGFAASLGQDALNFVPAGGAVKVVRVINSAVKGAKTVAAAANITKANKINHIFSKAEHGLSGVVKNLGGESKAFNAIEKAANKVVDKSKAGRFETTVKVAGEQVTVRGSVVEGQVKIGTAFIEKTLKQ